MCKHLKIYNVTLFAQKKDIDCDLLIRGSLVQVQKGKHY